MENGVIAIEGCGPICPFYDMRLFWLVCGVLLASCAVADASERGRKSLANIFYDELIKYHESGMRTPQLRRVVKTLMIPHLLEYPSLSALSKQIKDTLCDLCDSVVNAVLRYYHDGHTPAELADLVVDMCVLLEIQTEVVCTGLVNGNLDVVLYIIDSNPTISPERVCGVVLQSQQCYEDDPNYDWSIDVDLGVKPNATKYEEIGVSPQKNELNKADGDVITILHLSDFHYDPLYRAGGNAACDAPTCCRSNQGEPADQNSAAGYWGDYRNCDTPYEAIVDLLTHVTLTHTDLDYVYFTGDIIDHGVWETSRERNNESFNQVLPMLKESFGEIPVFPILGNHESHPMNQYSTDGVVDESVSSAWLYQTLLQHWLKWLPASVTDSVLHGGYYTVLLRPGLRLIALNNNVCYTFNWWLLHDPVDPNKQLTWLAETLLQAERDGEKVHILAHLPPGDSQCLKQWSREYNKIFNRFEHTIVAEFNGHSHNDEFHLYFAHEDPKRPSMVAYNGGSLTTYSDLNPNYRLYRVNASTGVVLDAETWVYNLTDANLNPASDPKWYMMYSFREAYGIDSMSLSSIEALTHKMAGDPNLVQQYYRFNSLDSDIKLGYGCNNGCMENFLCSIVTSYSEDRTQCDLLISEFRNNTGVFLFSAHM